MLFVIIAVRSLSITVSTSGFHPDNAGSTPAEITIFYRLNLSKITLPTALFFIPLDF